MTLANPDQSVAGAFGKSVLLNGLSGIFRTGRIKTTGAGQKRRDQLLIQPDYEEHNSFEHVDAPMCLKAFSSSR